MSIEITYFPMRKMILKFNNSHTLNDFINYLNLLACGHGIITVEDIYALAKGEYATLSDTLWGVGRGDA